MKNKIILSILGITIGSLLLITFLCMVIINYQQEQNIKKNLLDSNNLVIEVVKTKATNNIHDYFKIFNKEEYRVTLIDKNGKVLEDSRTATLDIDNHNSREEIKEARQYGNGFTVRYSKAVKKRMMYCATAFGNGYIVRSSMPMDVLIGFEGIYLKYYFIVLVIIFIMSIIFSYKLSYIIVKPIKELEFTTTKIAKGELDRRVQIKHKDEIGQLSSTFNNMADRLQYTLKGSIEEQNKLEAILKCMDNGVIAVDKDYNIIMINPYAEKIFGINEDIIGKNLTDCIKECQFKEIIKSNEKNKEIKILKPKNRDLKIRTTSIISNDDCIGTVILVQDISDIKRLENMRRQFVDNVSHELKTPLTSIKGFAETLRYVKDVNTKNKFLSIIDNETERLTRLINDILTLSDIEQHKYIKLEDIFVKDSIKDVYNLMKNAADKKNIYFDIVESENPVINGDKDRFKQMLINIVDNAIKYSENGDSVFIGTKVKNNMCIIWVEDTGVGIPKEHVPRLFERFYRVDKARSRSRGGTGLGLAIVKHIVLNFNGDIYVESELDKGTKFTIKIPLK